MTRRRRPFPAPPNPVDRREPLPWAHPKLAAEDATAAARQQTVMSNPSYIEPDRDLDFLHTDATRGTRLQLDYLKAEQGMAAYGIERTIVVFGSTRLREPETARRELEAARHELSAHPEDEAKLRYLHLAERRMELSHYYDVGRELGRLVGQSGEGPHDSRLVIMTGGGPGGMEAANRGAFDVGAHSVGLNITLPREQFPNPYVTPGLCFQFHYFALRKLHFMKRAAALVALPGGFGTLDELLGALTLVQTRKVAPMPIVLVGEAFWRSVLNTDFLLEHGHIDGEDIDLFWYAETAQEVWDSVNHWHQANGSDL
ncbi:MAG: LOG family protein [Betaproteobacteria bacterium]|nr:LOG family protein [Betaproteobacteria bacterium]